ncbi:hypothetical protein H7K20_00020 [Priestia aryabhattai]|uniref:YesK family protein n=1 Tax=Priestia aryabhattai TaxID=412384 RepID=A0ABD7X0S6_PRIAR|nr:YesK family protein [Priestia aryabhattai]MBY0025467.1 hypothetical protein [Priestia aryabhattai]WEA45947.1 YesK family protein [Priestia aryabhattai]HWL24140.1 YesK family protein [Ureibacillus sp.]
MAIMYLIVITTVTCLLLLSYKLDRTTSSLKYTIPLTAGMISLGVVIISYFYGGLTGMGIGVVNFAIFIGSIISIIIISVSEIIRSKERSTTKTVNAIPIAISPRLSYKQKVLSFNSAPAF